MSQSGAGNLYVRTSSPSGPHTTVPPSSNRPVSGSELMLYSNSLYEASVKSLIPPEVGDEFSFVVSFSSRRANNAFLFSIKDNRDRLAFGIQLLPRRVVVHTADNAPVFFTYNWQDGGPRPFAVGVRAHSVSFYADCGAVQQQREQPQGRAQTLQDPGGLFSLGRMNSKSAPFIGRVCQLDIYPSAEAAVHYCNYLKTQCRRADTYRLPHPGLMMEAYDPPFDPLIPSPVAVAATHHSALKSPAFFGFDSNPLVTQHPAPSSPVKPHLEDQSSLATLYLPSTTSLRLPGSPLPTMNPTGVLDPTESTTMKTTAQAGEEESSSGSLQATEGALDVITSVRQSQANGGPKPSSVAPRETLQLDTHSRGNSTTLYREDQVEQQQEQHSSYEGPDMGGYDYRYEDFLYEYEDGFRGPKGEPGAMVSKWILCSKQLDYKNKTILTHYLLEVWTFCPDRRFNVLLKKCLFFIYIYAVCCLMLISYQMPLLLSCSGSPDCCQENRHITIYWHIYQKWMFLILMSLLGYFFNTFGWLLS